MATPVKETVPEATPISPPTGGEKLYSMEELIILAKMEVVMNGAPFHYLDTDTSIPEDDREKRKAIVSALTGLVTDIRSKKAESSALFDYQDRHFDEPEYKWLQEHYPGLNVNGWRVFIALIDPLKYGKDIDRAAQQVLGTISKRSART
jgi:hypothetical protein